MIEVGFFEVLVGAECYLCFIYILEEDLVLDRIQVDSDLVVYYVVFL